MSKMVIELDLTREVPDPDDLRALCVALDAYSRNLSDKQKMVGMDDYNYTQSRDMDTHIWSLKQSIENSMEHFARWSALSEDERWPKPQQKNAETDSADQTG